MKKAEISTNIILWIGIFIISIISLLWFIQNLEPLSGQSNRVDFDLQELQRIIQLACTSVAYEREYNPRTETGTLTINTSTMCMNASSIVSCKKSPCPLHESKTFDLEKITTIKIIKQSGVINIE